MEGADLEEVWIVVKWIERSETSIESRKSHQHCILFSGWDWVNCPRRRLHMIVLGEESISDPTCVSNVGRNLNAGLEMATWPWIIPANPRTQSGIKWNHSVFFKIGNKPRIRVGFTLLLSQESRQNFQSYRRTEFDSRSDRRWFGIYPTLFHRFIKHDRSRSSFAFLRRRFFVWFNSSLDSQKCKSFRPLKSIHAKSTDLW
jgi:hypothetical protein